MLRYCGTAVVAVVFIAASAQAVIIHFLTDEVDDTDVVRQASDHPDVKNLGKELDSLRPKLYRFKERDFEALFGKPVPRAVKEFAMPVAQSRGVLLSGLRYAEEKKNKDHTEFYKAGRAGLEVYYHIDGVTPQVVLFYLQVDQDFPKLTRDNLPRRLAWERARIRRLALFCERRRAEVFVWEVDPEAEEKFYRGDYASEPKAKLDSWICTCKKLGYRMEVEQYSREGPRYSWYRPDGSLARVVHSHFREQLPGEFIWYHEGSGREYRRESFHKDRVNWWRWGRPHKGSNIRFETADESGRPTSWTWEDGEGNVIRREWDDNGDGIPDLFAQTRGGKVGHRLPLEESWAVHPELIPKESRIPDQPDRRVPLRKSSVPPQKEE